MRERLATTTETADMRVAGAPSTVRSATPQPGLLIIGPLPAPKGGVSVHIERLRRTLAARGIASAVLDESRIAKPGIANLRRITPWGYVACLLRARVIHVHSGNLMVRLMHTVAGRLLGRKVVQTLHSFKGPRSKSALAHLSCRLSNRNILVNDKLASRFDPTGRVVPAFIPPGPDDEVIPPDLADWIGRQKQSGRAVVSLNGFQPELHDGVCLYGYDLLIDAFAAPEIRSRFAALLVISSLQMGKDYYEDLQRRIAERGLGDQVLLVSRAMSFCGVLKYSDVFVRPTTSDGDALSIRECLWYGKPVVASDAAVRPEGTILFRSRDAADLAQKLLVAIDSPPPAPLQRDFAEDVLAVYEEMLGRRPKVSLPA